MTKLSSVATSRRLADFSLWRETQLSLVKTASGHRKFPSAETPLQEQTSQVTRHPHLLQSFESREFKVKISSFELRFRIRGNVRVKVPLARIIFERQKAWIEIEEGNDLSL